MRPTYALAMRDRGEGATTNRRHVSHPEELLTAQSIVRSILYTEDDREASATEG